MARDAANSEFVILSLCGQASFSATMKEWIESWLLAGNRPASLIALFDPARSIAPRAERDRRYLRRLAQEAGVAFFAHCAAGSMSLEVNPPEEHPTPQPLLRSRPRLGAFRPASAVAAILTSAVA